MTARKDGVCVAPLVKAGVMDMQVHEWRNGMVDPGSWLLIDIWGLGANIRELWGVWRWRKAKKTGHSGRGCRPQARRVP